MGCGWRLDINTQLRYFLKFPSSYELKLSLRGKNTCLQVRGQNTCLQVRELGPTVNLELKGAGRQSARICQVAPISAKGIFCL